MKIWANINTIHLGYRHIFIPKLHIWISSFPGLWQSHFQTKDSHIYYEFMPIITTLARLTVGKSNRRKGKSWPNRWMEIWYRDRWRMFGRSHVMDRWMEGKWTKSKTWMGGWMNNGAERWLYRYWWSNREMDRQILEKQNLGGMDWKQILRE